MIWKELILIFCFFCGYAYAANILFLNILPSPSHHFWSRTVLNELAKNGPNPKNVRHVKSNNWEWVLPQRNQKLTWNRDISAARNILYKGICAIMDIPIDITLDRLRHAENQALRPMPIADDLISGLLRAFHITPPPPQRQAQNVQQGGEQVDEWNDNQQNDTPNDQQANAQNIAVENNAQNEAQVDQQNQQHVPENVQQNYFYMHW